MDEETIRDLDKLIYYSQTDEEISLASCRCRYLEEGL